MNYSYLTAFWIMSLCTVSSEEPIRTPAKSESSGDNCRDVLERGGFFKVSTMSSREITALRSMYKEMDDKEFSKKFGLSIPIPIEGADGPLILGFSGESNNQSRWSIDRSEVRNMDFSTASQNIIAGLAPDAIEAWKECMLAKLKENAFGLHFTVTTVDNDYIIVHWLAKLIKPADVLTMSDTTPGIINGVRIIPGKGETSSRPLDPGTKLINGVALPVVYRRLEPRGSMTVTLSTDSPLTAMITIPPLRARTRLVHTDVNISLRKNVIFSLDERNDDDGFGPFVQTKAAAKLVYDDQTGIISVALKAEQGEVDQNKNPSGNGSWVRTPQLGYINKHAANENLRQLYEKAVRIELLNPPDDELFQHREPHLMGVVSEGLNGPFETATKNGLVESWVNRLRQIEINLHANVRVRVYSLEEVDDDKEATYRRRVELIEPVAPNAVK
jgi:hypothetical protein